MLACTNFFGPTSDDRPERSFEICTIGFDARQGIVAPQRYDRDIHWGHALAASDALCKAVERSLASSGSYPFEEGYAFRSYLGWRDGLELLLGALDQAARLQLGLGPESCLLVPELLPVDLPGRSAWLDTVCPIFRQFGVVAPPAQYCPRRSLAIVHGEKDDNFDFPAAAGELQEALWADDFPVNVYGGAEFKDGDNERLFFLLQEIFCRHRAVLFVGHGRQGRSDEGGWQLSPRFSLTMARLAKFLSADQRRPIQGSGSGRWTVPEVVFANCCVSAGRDVDRRGQMKLLYPQLFLHAGVRFFIGTSRYVVFQRPEELQRACRLAREFFLRWRDEPDVAAVEHLFAAKRACEHHLLTSLYQIYSAEASSPATPQETAPSRDLQRMVQPTVRQPMGSVVLGLQPGDRLGAYELECELWADPLSRTFAARHIESLSLHMVQVLADPLQDDPDIGARLEDAIGRLRSVEGAEEAGHLFPTRREQGLLRRGAETVRPLEALVYDRPASEAADSWRPLSALRLDRDANETMPFLLGLAAQLADALDKLHRREIVHGNLDTASVVFRRQRDGTEQTLIKDAWVRLAGISRCTQTQFAPPEELAHAADDADRFKYDCWGLGVILYELVVGRSPFDDKHPQDQGLRRRLADVLGDAAQRVPPALDRIIRECLVPSARLRPSAELVGKRLQLALQLGGNYVGELESQLNAHVQAGHRLFSLAVGDFEEAENTLLALASHPHPNVSPCVSRAAPEVRYRIYVAAEHVGLVERRAAGAAPAGAPAMRELVPWIDVPHAQPTECASYNADRILSALVDMRPAAPGEIPIVLLRGNGWWDLGPVTWRLFKSFQSKAESSPVIVIADDVILLEEHTADSFVHLVFPPPSPAVLFERILALLLEHAPPDAAGPDDRHAETALQLAHGFYPTPQREVDQALRLCWLEHGVFDQRALTMRDDERERSFSRLGTVRYTPVSRLPPLEHVGIPPDLAMEVMKWCWHVSTLYDDPRSADAARRILLTGPEGCGKSLLARALGAASQRPVIGIDANTCLRGGVGASEAALRSALAAADRLPNCLVLLADIDRFFLRTSSASSDDSPGRLLIGAQADRDQRRPPPDAFQTTLMRMSGILLRWLDQLAKGLVVVATTVDESRLPLPWRWRMDRRWRLDPPMERQDLAYRCQVFAALFRKFKLERLAADSDLMRSLARETHPAMRAWPLRSPLARRLEGSISGQAARLETGAEIEAWIKDTIVLHDRRDRKASDRQFWLEAVH